MGEAPEPSSGASLYPGGAGKPYRDVLYIGNLSKNFREGLAKMEIAEVLKNITLIGTAGAVLWKMYKVTRLIEDMHKDAEQRKKENEVIIHGVLASLDGLAEIGANGAVANAKKKIEEFLIRNRE